MVNSEVSAAHRYAAAWAEINARLQSRQFIQGTYMTGVIVAVILGVVPAEHGSLSNPSSWRKLAVVILPLLSLSVALWIRHNDAIIGLLSRFCQEIEMANDPDQTSIIPGWHDTRYRIIDAALGYRRWSDAAFILVALTGCVPAFAMAFPAMWQKLIAMARQGDTFVFSVAAALGLGSVVIVWRNARIRQSIKDAWIYGWVQEGANWKRQWGWSKDRCCNATRVVANNRPDNTIDDSNLSVPLGERSQE